MPKDISNHNHGNQFKPEVQNTIKLTLAFTKAAAKHQKDKDDNLVVSPYNALTCMAMVAKGADSETKAEFAKILFGADASDLDVEIAKLSTLNTEVLAANKEQVTLKTANGVWSNKALLELDEGFAEELKTFFDAEISGEDFSDLQTVKKINAWAAENTNDLIKEIVKELSPDDFAVLASSLYFKGDWTNKFDKALTKNREFIADNGTIDETATMHQDFEKEGAMTYLDGGDYEAVALTYGEKDFEAKKAPTMRMIMMRPKDDNISARDFLAGHDVEKVPAWANPSCFENALGSVELPHMDIKQNHDIIPVLEEMGIKSAFNNNSDFSKMVKNRGNELYLSKVSHDVVFKTNEEGSEAAAVTSVVVTMKSCISTPKRVDIKFDRSYVFALQDIKTGTVLFVGAVNKPNKDMKPISKPNNKM